MIPKLKEKLTKETQTKETQEDLARPYPQAGVTKKPSPDLTHLTIQPGKEILHPVANPHLILLPILITPQRLIV